MKVNITGGVNKTYDLDELSKKNTRLADTEELKVQIWYWNPNLDATNPHSKPNPPQPEIGMLWLSKLVEKDSPKYLELAKGTPTA